MFRRFMEWLKGGYHTSEACIDMQTVNGEIPAWGRWEKETYRFQVWVYRDTVTRDASWVRPVHKYRYEVRPMTTHQLPVDRRSNTIYITEKAERWFVDYHVDTAVEAADAYVNYILGIRMAFEASRQQAP